MEVTAKFAQIRSSSKSQLSDRTTSTRQYNGPEKLYGGRSIH